MTLSLYWRIADIWLLAAAILAAAGTVKREPEQ